MTSAQRSGSGTFQMNAALWIYCAAMSVFCVTLAIAIPWFGRIFAHEHPGTELPVPTMLLFNYAAVLYAVPLPWLIAAIWFLVKGGLEASRLQLIAACSFFTVVFLACVTLLAFTVLYLPWGGVIR